MKQLPLTATDWNTRCKALHALNLLATGRGYTAYELAQRVRLSQYQMADFIKRASFAGIGLYGEERNGHEYLYLDVES